MELQHVNVKLFLNEASAIDFEKVVELFHQWISEQSMDELLIDVADYLHVPSGPGIVLVGHEADYALDHAQGRWGILYNRKIHTLGENCDRFSHAFHSAAKACARLEQDSGLSFLRTEFYLTINDRALAPNTDETFQTCRSEIAEFVRNELRVSDVEITPEPDRRRRFGVHVKCATPFEFPVAVK